MCKKFVYLVFFVLVLVFVLPSIASAADPNLAGWWKFDGDPCDSSGYGRNGSLGGNPSYAAGYDVNALEFDGAGDYVSISGYKGVLGSDNRTCSAWIKTRASGVIMSWGSYPGSSKRNGRQWVFDVIGNGRLRLFLSGGNVRSSTNVKNGEWRHVAAVMNGNKRDDIDLYVDGVLETMVFNGNNVTVSTGTAGTAVNVQIGRKQLWGGSRDYFTGLIDDARIYDKKLSEVEIGALIRVDVEKAWGPIPSDGATDVGIRPILMWNPGDYAPDPNGHKVYFGADDPGNMVVVSAPNQPQTASEYDPGTLDLGRTYYWRIDEVNGAAPDGVDPGDIWSFTIVNSLVVDDFDGYSDDMWAVWIDGAGDCAGNDSNSGAILYEESSTTHGGSSGSMKYDYDNDGTVETNPCGSPLIRPKYSRAVAKVADLPSGIGSNWLTGSAKALALRFRGVLSNDPNEKMWVELTDASGRSAKVTYGPPHVGEDDINDVNEASWHQWNIDLQEFVDSNGVNLADVNAIAIGFGNPGETPSPGRGYGTMYIDDIRLYASRCILAKRDADFAKLDYAPRGRGGDCVIDAKELNVMFGDWLESDIDNDLTSVANVYDEEPEGSKIINFKDYALVAERFLDESMFP